MPQELKQVNGRWVVTGAQQSSDLAPTVKAGFKPAAPKPQAKPKPKPAAQSAQPRPWWSKLMNDARYEVNSLRAGKLPHLRLIQSNPAVGFAGQINLGIVGAGDNAARLAYSVAQRAKGRQKADASSGRVGGLLDQLVDHNYRRLGATPPSQMSKEQRDFDQMRRSVVGNLLLAPVTPGFGFAGATTTAGRVVRGGAAFAVNETLSTAVDDSTGGNIANMIGPKTPFAVNVGVDDMVDAYVKSIIPNAATSLVVGGVAGGAVSLAQRFPNIRRNIRARRAVEQEVRQRAKQESMGVLQKDEADGLDFTPQAKQPAQPAPAPEPTFQEANAAMEERLGMRPAQAAPEPAAVSAGDQIEQIFTGMGKGLTEGLDNAVWEGLQGRGAMRSDPIVLNLQRAQAAIGRPLERDEALALAKGAYAKAGADPVGSEHWIAQLQEQFGLAAPAKAPAEPASIPTIDNATADNFGKAQAAELPDADPALDPWTYDPDLPESTALGKALEGLSDSEIQTVLNAPGLDVVERVNQVIEARAGVEPRPPVDAGMVMAPTDKLADDYLKTVIRKLGAREDYELRPLFDPEVNPALWQRAQALTGVDDAAQLTKADMLDSLTAMAADGQAPIVNRMMGGQMLPTAEVQAAPQVFQYKGGVNDAGEQIGNSLEGLERWDPNAEGIPQVWRDVKGEIGPPGVVYVVNGHNRLAAAKRMGIPSLRVEFLDAPTAAEARLQGAIANISDGKGTVFDAAKLAREQGITTTRDLKRLGKPQASGFWRDGIALSRLPEDVFQGAVNAPDELLPMYRLIGESGASPEIMRSAHIQITKDPKTSAAELVEMMDWAKAQQNTATAKTSQEQGRLPFEDWDSTFDEKMLAMQRLAAEINILLGKEKRLFRGAGKNADALSPVAVVDAKAAGQIGDEAARAQQIFKDLKYTVGPVNDLLNEGVARVMAGESAPQVAQGIKNRLAASISEAMGKEVAPAVDVVQEDMFAAAGRAADEPAAPLELTPDERLAAEAQLLQQAAANGQIRPPTAPIPDLPEPAQVRLDALDEAKLPQATADEIRLAVEHKQSDAALAFEQQQALRDATEYEALTFDEKKNVGLAADLDEVITPEVMPPRYGLDSPAAGGGFGQAAEPTAPIRPEPLRLTAPAPQPEFTLPGELNKAAPRYGTNTVTFQSDLDRAAYVLANDAVKPSKAAGKFRQVVQEAGLNLDEVVAHGKQVKAALKQAAKGNPGQIELPAQPWRRSPMTSPQLLDDLNDPAKEPLLERLLVGDAPPAEQELILKQLGNERLEGVWTLGQEGAADRLEKDILEFVQQMTGGRMKGSRLDADIADAVFVRTNNAGYGGGGVAVPQQVGGVNSDYIYNESGAVLLIARYDNFLNRFGLAEMAQTGVHEAVHFLQARRLTQKQLEVLASDEAVAYFRSEAGKARKWGRATDLENIELMAWGSQRVIAARLLRDMESIYRKQGLKKAAAYVAQVRANKLGEYVAPPAGVEKALEPLIQLWERIKNYLLGAGFKRNTDLTTEQLKIIGDFTDSIAGDFKRLAKAIDPRSSVAAEAAMPPKAVRELLDAAYTGQIGKQMYLRPGRMRDRALANYERRWDVLGVSPSDYDASTLPPTQVGAQRVRQQIEANNQAINDIRRKAQQEGC